MMMMMDLEDRIGLISNDKKKTRHNHGVHDSCAGKVANNALHWCPD